MSGDQREEIEVKELEIDFQLNIGCCVNSSKCRLMVDRNRERLIGRYIGNGIVDKDRQVVAAVLSLGETTFEDYINNIKKYSKGAALRQAKKAQKKNYYCKPFQRKLFLPDIVTINHSKEVRSGGKMKPAYLKSLEEMGGAPKQYYEYSLPDCPIHCDVWWGIFCSDEGYTQGDVCTNERLLGYIDFRRVGNYGIYSLILGHGEFLGDGIMNELHLNIVKWLLEPGNAYGQGLRYLVYAGYNQGGDGLRQWKRKFDFKPAYLWASQGANTGRRLSSFIYKIVRPLKSMIKV